jgi:hypothetical protein
MVLRLNMHRWLLVFALSAFGNSSFAQVQIVSAEESRLPEGQVLATRAITRGPGISLSSGQEVQASSFPLNIKFEPRGGVALDVASLKVEYLKQPIVDVTERVRVGIRGDSIDAPCVRLLVASLDLQNRGRDERTSWLDTENPSKINM